MAPTISIEFAGHRESKKLSQKVVSQMMGKTRKVSKGYPRGFVPDYRHAVETMAESEDFGGSGWLNAGITASEELRAPKRKCISLTGDASEQFGVPFQVLSLSKLSSFQRKDLTMRLKHELEQVRTYQKEIAKVSSGDVALFPSSKPVSRGMKRAPPPGQNAGGRAKKQASGRLDPVNKALPPVSGNAMLMKQCDTLLNRLIGHTYGWVFKVPVDVVALKIPDYYTVIKHPMDLGTVRTKLTSGKYADPWGFAADVRLTFSNALTYNPRGNDVHMMAETISKFFEVRWKPIEKKLSPAAEAVASPKQAVLMETVTAVPISPIEKKKRASVDSEIKQVPAKRVMSDVEKHKLSSELEELLADLPESIIDFLKENSSNGNQTTEDEIEIDIDTLSSDTLLKLRSLLDEYVADKQKNTVKAETSEIERHELGFSNSLMQPCKANDRNKEDLDIDGNDLPISTISPMVLEKDSAVRKSKGSNSSSSSSEDGSSSGDSGTSTGSDADDAKASAVVNNVKLTLGSERIAIPSATEPENQSANGVSQVEQKSRSNPISGEVDDRQEGESAQSERQVSPVKLYRAALLKSRFADTILKAQEKTTGKGEKQDPERSRLEKVELEKRRRAEKARLQAEAKAAEEARRKAEAEAAAEAKRKREVEREAARQALQKMEKTVDIDENSQFLEDLELLQAAPMEPLIDETSPVHSLDPLGSFKFQGNSNPLEQLGLYMKDDDEEEEEVKPDAAPALIDDPEEGEID
ncbi:transcription factor GTE10-like isoform X1 [Cynara cardunculus var. scolymus]|uniref:transcription factor GTE10-like isoform X1 n=1 Tax=Cynara cardunculus var. scolymus TaxID=59895 RepID=UPI000D625AD9|nr:transcription factor GTE10-like isoform X1 [Cynara cardunculus var. scolymus]XP_024970989.1 transcription factor GTE10-like isoform X1 [Cynara cardunculus var. scolymus]